MPSIQYADQGPGVDTASAVFPLQHTVLSALTERINLDKSPTYVILDSGCTRAMGSRYAVNRLIKAVERYAPGKIEFTFEPSNTKFSFADSETALIKERVTLWFNTTPRRYTTIEVLDQGKVPILFSIEQMRNLRMTLECSPTADLATCDAFGLYKTPLPISTNNHLVLDLLGFTSTRKYPAKSGSSFQVSESALGSGSAPEGRCPACEGMHRAHTYKKGCKRAVPDTSPPPPAPTVRTKGKAAPSPVPKPAETSAGPSEPSSGSGGPLPEDSRSPEHQAEDRLELPSGTVKTPASLKRLMKKTKEHKYVPKTPVDEGSLVPGADNGTKVRPLESKEYPASGPKSPSGEGITEEEPVPDAAPSLPLALRRIHDKLKDPVELYKLHLKHRHMNLEQFKRRTTALQIPKEIYELYDQLVKKCSTCQEHKRAPSRAKISGLRSDTFGDLTFVDHGELPIPGKNSRLVFLILYDGATNLLTSEVVQDKEEHTTMSVMNDYFEKYQINLKVVVGDQAFMTPQMEAHYNRQNIKPVATGPGTPWPNRAEAAVRLLKHQLKIIPQTIKDGDPMFNGITMKYGNLVRQACLARNSSVTYAGVTPLEMAFGRRPRDVITPENSEPNQLTGNPTDTEVTARAIRELANKAYQEARQSDDLRRDLASRLSMSDGPFTLGDKVYYWSVDTSKIGSTGSRQGSWIKGKVISELGGSMVGVDLGTRIVRVNVSKLRKNHDVTSDVDIPLAPAEESLSSEGSDHASCMVTFDASLTSADLSVPQYECHWQVTGTGKIDFLELYGGSSRMSHKAALSGLRVGQPVDLRSGLDLEQPHGRVKLLKIIKEQEPTIIVVSPDHSQWYSWYSQWKKGSAKGLPAILRFCESVADHQMKLGRYFVLENPYYSRLWSTPEAKRLLSNHKVSYEVCNLQAYGMKDPEGYYQSSPATFMHNLPQQVLSPIRRSYQKPKSSESSPKSDSGIRGYGLKTKLSQVYPYEFCDTFAACLAKFLNRDSYASHLSLLTDLLQYPGDECLQGLSELLDKEYSLLTINPLKDSKLLQDPKIRSLVTKVNSLPNKTEIALHHSKPSPSLDALVSDITHLRSRLLPGSGFEQCTLYRGTFGTMKTLASASDGVLVFWNKKRPNQTLTCCMPHQVSWDKMHPTTFSGVLFQMSGGKQSPSVRPPPDVIMPDMEVSPSDPSEPMSTNRSRITSDDASMPEPDEPMPPDSPPSRPPPPSPPPGPPAVSSDEPVAPARAKPRVHPPPRSPSPRRLGGDVSPRSSSERKVSPYKQKSPPLAPTPKPKPKAAPQQSGPILPVQEGDEESSEELAPDDPGQPSILPHSSGSPEPESDAESDDTRYYSDEEGDLVVDEKDWILLTEEQKLCSNTGSFSMPRYMSGSPIDIREVTSRIRSDRTRYQPSRKNRSDIREEYDLLTEDDKALSVSPLKGLSNLSQKAQRKEATAKEKRELKKQFDEAKAAEYQSWLDNDVFELIDTRKLGNIRNYVTGRWVLTLKRDKDGNFLKCKARWVLRGFQDRQKDIQQTDSPAASRPGFRLAIQLAANKLWNLTHIDLKTAFLQGEAYDESRDIICQIPPEAGYPPYITARMKKPAYGLNDAPRRWWNIVDKALLSYGLVPTRADRCTYVLYGKKSATAEAELKKSQPKTMESAIDYLLDPIAGNNAKGREVHGVVCLHVDDLCMAGDDTFLKVVIESIKKEFAVGSEDTNDIMFVGQRLVWKDATASTPAHISVNQNLAVEALEEIVFDKKLKNEQPCTPQQHTAYRSVLGQINWLQSRTQVHICYRFSRCASKAAKPTIGDVRELNKLVRVLKATEVELRFWPLKGNLRILGYPDASYRNNDDKSSQRAHVIFLAEERNPKLNGMKQAAAAASSKKNDFSESSIKETSSRGSLVDYESHKITTTTMSTTVAELNALMRCFGTCLFLKGLWADLSSETVPIHIRTDANNLVTTAGTTHLPEQKETHHLIQMLRKESNSGSLDDLAHVSSKYCLADALTKHSAQPDELIKALETGNLPETDIHAPFRELLQHKAFTVRWIINNLKNAATAVAFLGLDISSEIYKIFYCQGIWW